MERVFLGWERPGLAAAVDVARAAVRRARHARSGRRGHCRAGWPGGPPAVGADRSASGAGRPAPDPAEDHHGGPAARAALSGQTPVCRRPGAAPRLGRGVAANGPRPVAGTSCRRRRPRTTSPPGSRWPRCSGGSIASWPRRPWISPTWPIAARGFPGFREATRWQALAEVQQRYLRTLDGVGLWDLQTARLVAIRNGECTTPKRDRARRRGRSEPRPAAHARPGRFTRARPWFSPRRSWPTGSTSTAASGPPRGRT